MCLNYQTILKKINIDIIVITLTQQLRLLNILHNPVTLTTQKAKVTHTYNISFFYKNINSFT